MAIELTTYDVAEHLDSEEEIRLYLEAAFEDGDPKVITNAIGNVAKARGMSEVAKSAGISRAGLYRALGENGNPSLETLSAILHSFGMRLAVAAA
ncbi:addiction module antidote protein [Novosphingobium sp.]|uniref:addiction module antidote protein n=1 Tax=Novosphingobium sp. TaxID=1874826 RepID=UPI0031D82BE4